MVNTRRNVRDAMDDDQEPPTQVVNPRRSNTPEPTEPTEPTEEMEPSEDSDPEEMEPSEDSDPEEAEPSEDSDPEETHPLSPHPVPSPVASPSPSTPPVPTSPIVPSSPAPIPHIPTTTFTSYRPADPLSWDWMPTVLGHWRKAEKIPTIPPTPGSQTSHLTLTQESVHDTIPVLITRLLSHDHQLELLERATHDRMDAPTSEVELIQHQVSGIENDLIELRDELVTTHNEGVEMHEEMEALTRRVLSAEDRVLAAENRAQRMESQMEAMRQEIIALQADRDHLREVNMYAVRTVERLERLCERLR